MSLRVKADADKLERFAEENGDKLKEIAGRARELGCIHHRFAADNGDVVVMDEWESEDAFHKFFDGADDVREVMEQMGVQSEPQVTFFRPLETGDDF
jgi:heme-degrading monooxygenase HmoA